MSTYSCTLSLCYGTGMPICIFIKIQANYYYLRPTTCYLLPTAYYYYYYLLPTTYWCNPSNPEALM